MILFKFKYNKQIPSGKNSVVVTRSGHRFPNKRFSDWKKDILPFIQAARKEYKIEKPIDFPVNVIVEYTAGDKRRRDVPGMIDAIWHVIEHGGIVSDDRYLGGDGKEVHWLSLGIDKVHYGIEVTIYE